MTPGEPIHSTDRQLSWKSEPHGRYTVRELRVHCPRCGELDLPAGEVVVSQRSHGVLTYTFRCPHCRDIAEKACDSQVGRLLLLGGAQSTDATAAGLAAFRPEDVTVLRDLLDSPDWFDRLLRAS
jgi:hypothetical protein